MLPLLADRPLFHALGWTLLHFVWQGALVAVALVGVLALLRGATAQLRYAVACASLAGMVLLPAITFARLAMSVRSPQSPQPSSIMDRAPASGSPEVRGPAGSLLESIDRLLDRSLKWIVPLWIAGVMLLLGRVNLGLWAARRMTSPGAQPAAAELQRMLHDLARRMKVSRAIALAHCAAVQAPVVIGCLRPVILIPLGCMAGLSPAQVEALIAHEVAHIRRNDYLIAICQSVAEALLFYHPAVWWVSKQIRKERELCCDDAAVAVCGDSLAYARALAHLEAKRSSGPLIAPGAGGGDLKMRIQRLLGASHAPDAARTAAVTVLALGVLASGLWLAVRARADSRANDQTAAGSPQLTGIYKQWLERDVRWIITPEEREAYLRLQDDPEREKFIEQFWERRNSSLGSTGNKFKDENYRRIAYANLRFSSAGEEGWRSDRGRIYIVYGPPDSIDAFPQGTNSGSKEPGEFWHYRSIREAAPAVREQGAGTYRAESVTRENVSFRFVDACHCGDYQLASEPDNR